MLPRSRTALSGLRLALDLLDVPVLYLVLLGAYLLRFQSDWFPAPPVPAPPSLATYRATFALLAVAWCGFLWAGGFYDRLRFDVKRSFHLLGLLVMAQGFTLAAFFFRRDFSYSRLTLLIAFALSFVGLALFHIFKSQLLMALLRRGCGRAKAVAVGPGTLALPCMASFSTADEMGLDLLGYLGDPPSTTASPPGEGTGEVPPTEEGHAAAGRSQKTPPIREMDLPYTHFGPTAWFPNQNLDELERVFPRLGAVQDLREVVEREGVQEIFVTYPMDRGVDMLEVVRACENTPAAVRVVPDMLSLITHGVQMRLIAGIPVLDMGKHPMQGVEGFLKRVMDVVGAALGLLLLSPLFLFLAWLVKRDSPGPIFYAQERVGMDGRPFIIYKFRSMPVDAEASTGPIWASRGDPRATSLGRFLRKWSLDELPQLYNVLTGDMSLVGPRPERPYFVDKFRQNIRGYMQRHKVKAGLTGWAQINGLRGQSPIEERTRYDVWYIENWSLLLDLEILLRTLHVCVVRPEG